MTQPLADEIQQLAKAHPVLTEVKMSKRLARIERMTNFYKDKAPAAPENQGLMFEAFVSSLIYAASIIRMYNKLTKKLAELAEEAESDRI